MTAEGALVQVGPLVEGTLVAVEGTLVAAEKFLVAAEGTPAAV